jgi:phenylglyoxylate dehydrogenase delta subunit
MTDDHHARPMFDADTVPGDLCPISTTPNPMLAGDWRAERPVVDREKCVKCAACWIFCPVQCIEERPRWFDINYAACKGCGICAHECPQHAITMVQEENK